MNQYLLCTLECCLGNSCEDVGQISIDNFAPASVLMYLNLKCPLMSLSRVHHNIAGSQLAGVKLLVTPNYLFFRYGGVYRYDT